MCLRCHFKLSDEEVYGKLNDVYKNNNFDDINFVRIYNLLIAASGYNGKHVRELALKVLAQYREYLFKNPWNILYGILSVKDLERKVKFLISDETPKGNKALLVEYLNRCN